MDHEITGSRPAESARVGVGAARRASSESWQTVAPTAVVLLVLAALVLLPFAHDVKVRHIRAQMRGVAEPARAEVTRLHVALALEGSFVSDYLETRDSTIARRYQTAVGQEEQATARLAPLTERLGTDVQARFHELRVLLDAWHRTAERAIAAPGVSGGDRVALMQGDEYERVLLAAAHLDEVIDLEVQSSRASILEAERAQRRVSVVLALLGFVGAGAVAWLARRLRRYAVTLEEQSAELQRSTEGRARLMRGISHDLKNPMHAIDGHAQLLEDHILGPLQSAQQDSVARIRRGVRSMLALVEDLLELSRAESGHLTVRPRPTQLTTLLHEAVDEHRGAARAAGHEIALAIAETPPPPVTIVTDAERVRQVLGNLLSNAVKYTPAGGHILVRAERRARPSTVPLSGWMAIDVVDTGPGIPVDQVEAIFDEFARLPLHADKPGSGLGLAIARRITGLLGGDITVRTEPQGGACFTLWLPIEAGA